MKTTFTRVSKCKLGYDMQRVDQFLAQAKNCYVATHPDARPGDADDETVSDIRAVHNEIRAGSSRSAASRSDTRSSRSLRNQQRAIDTTIDAASIAGVAFPMVHGGYAPSAVDAALDRLQTAFVQRQRAAVLTQSGEEAWLDATYELARQLYPRLRRPKRARFADAKKTGYAKAPVDRFLDRVNAYFAGKAHVSVHDARMITFPAAKKADAYDEAVVDVYIEELIRVLLAVE